jgi:hypothetical protein
MLTLTLPAVESFDEVKNEFVYSEETIIELEHSLFSLSKWEQKFEKPFLGKGGNEEKTLEETIGYIQAMTVTPNVPPEVYQRITNAHFQEINQYIEAKMSATWFNEQPSKKPSREIVTAEIIYYWMSELKIPLEWEHRHLNQLFTYIKVANQKNSPEKKMNKRDMIAERNRINAERQAKLNTTG